MRKLLIITLVASLTFLGCAQEGSKYPQGAWKLVQVIDTEDGITTIVYQGENNKEFQYKMWTEKKWMFINEYIDDTVVSNYYGGGTYTFDGNQYVENIEFTNMEGYKGITVKMTMGLVEDTLIQSYHPLDTLGQELENVLISEKYIRWED